MEVTEETIESLATFLYPQDAIKRLSTFREGSEIELESLRTKELLYKYSHEKFWQLCQKRAMRAVFEHFEEYSKNHSPNDEDGRRALEVVRETMLNTHSTEWVTRVFANL